jgi:hypothetical protein
MHGETVEFSLRLTAAVLGQIIVGFVCLHNSVLFTNSVAVSRHSAAATCGPGMGIK